VVSSRLFLRERAYVTWLYTGLVTYSRACTSLPQYHKIDTHLDHIAKVVRHDAIPVAYMAAVLMCVCVYKIEVKAW
jgi:hypothetical protein